MRKVFSLIAVLLLTFGGHAGAQELCTDSTCASSNSYKQVFETVKGAADGQNRVFQVSQTPANQYPFRLFRNGVELSPGTDFSLQDTFITLNGRSIESGGDVIQASYTARVPPLRSTPASLPSPQMNGTITAVLNRFLDRALVEQLRDAPVLVAPVSASEPQRAETFATARRQQPAPLLRVQQTDASPKPVFSKNVTADFASLRMLKNSLAQSSTVEKDALPLRGRQRALPSQAQGTEGLGDDVVSSPFDLLSAAYEDSRKVKTSQLNSASKADANRPSTRHQPLSLRMLKRSIEGDK